MEVKLAKTAGFCFGVDRAVNLVYDLIEKGNKVCTLGPIIHNQQLVDDLISRGVKIIDDTRSDNWGTVVFFAGDENSSYYDSQKINVPEGKVVKQVGTYSYMTQNEMYKTVPVVEIMAE